MLHVAITRAAPRGRRPGRRRPPVTLPRGADRRGTPHACATAGPFPPGRRRAARPARPRPAPAGGRSSGGRAAGLAVGALAAGQGPRLRRAVRPSPAGHRARPAGVVARAAGPPGHRPHEAGGLRRGDPRRARTVLRPGPEPRRRPIQPDRCRAARTSRLGATTRYASSQISATSAQSRPTSSRRPIQPLPPTYGGRKKRSGSASTSSACTPGGAAHTRWGKSSWW